MSLLAVAATLAMGITSCSNDNDAVINNDEGRSVSLKVTTGKSATRAEEASQSGQSTGIDATLGGAVYFLNGDVVTDFFPILPDASATGIDIKVSDLSSTTGHLFTNVSGSASQVYVVLNKPGNMVLPGAGSTQTAIEAVAMNITDFTAIDKVMMKGIGTIQPPATGTTHTAAVQLAPVVARFEIAKVEYDQAHASNDANPLTKFELKGIFVNNHHKTMPLSFTPGAPYSSSVAADYTVANFPLPLSGLTGTYVNALSYVPTTGAAWAYQFFPIDAANNANDQPMLVFQLDVVDTDGTLTGQQFVSVDRYETPAGVAITKFEPNHIYKITSLKFSNRNLDPKPNVTLRDVIVTVTVTPWVDVSINPIV